MMRYSALYRACALRNTRVKLAQLGARAPCWHAIPTAHYDVCVIGGGPGGIAAALHAVDYGKKVCIVEKHRLGGADLWNGTLMSKMMWERGDVLSKINGHNARRVFGHTLKDCIALNESQMRCDVERVSHTRARQLLAALNATHVDLLYGHASFISDTDVQLRNKETHEYRTIRADYFVIATGSTPRPHPFAAIDGSRVVTSDHLMQIFLPRRMVIVGAGPLGCEFASIYARLGKTQVYLIDKASHVLPTEDNDVVRMVERHMHESGVVIHHDSVLYDMQVFDSSSPAHSSSPCTNHTDADDDLGQACRYTSGTEGSCTDSCVPHNLPYDSANMCDCSAQVCGNDSLSAAHSNSVGGVRYTVMHRATRELSSFEVDCALIAVGRQPNYASLGLENTTLQVANGVIVVNAFCQSISCPHMYVIGDAVSSAQLVSVAESQGRRAMDHIYGTTLPRGCSSINMTTQPTSLSYFAVNSMMNPNNNNNNNGGSNGCYTGYNYSSMCCSDSAMRHRHLMTDLPQSRAAVIFLSHPVASVGFNETDCRARRIAYLAASIGYEAVSRTIAADRTDGLLKIIVSDDGARQLLGVRAVGMHASTLVNLGALAIEHRYTVDDMARMLTAYPAVSQAFQECLRAICATPSSTTATMRHGGKDDVLRTRDEIRASATAAEPAAATTIITRIPDRDGMKSGMHTIRNERCCEDMNVSTLSAKEELASMSREEVENSAACASGSARVVTTEAVGAAVAGVQLTRWSPPYYERGAVYQAAQMEACMQKQHVHKHPS